MFILLSGHSFLRCSKWRVSWRWFARTSSRRRELDQTICHCSSSLTFKSHYPRVESDLRYSEPHVAKTSPLSSAQLTKSRQKWETTWPIKHGQSVAQKAVRNMSTKDNPGTLPMNICLTEHMIWYAVLWMKALFMTKIFRDTQRLFLPKYTVF